MVYQDRIIELVSDPNPENRRYAAYVFRYFSDFPDKEKAWEDLHRLTQDENSIVRQNTAFIYQYIYDKVSQKDKLIEWLFGLTEDKSNRVKAAAYYLVRWDTIDFCFTVHSLFYKILNEDVKSVDEIRNNILPWKNRPVKSEERQNLLEILESLGTVLEETLIAKMHGEDAWRYKEKILPFCTKADELIKSLKHHGMREIASKAKDQVQEEYIKTVDILLSKVNGLINEPEQLEKDIDLLFPIIREYCELIDVQVVREKIKHDISEIQNESNSIVRYKLGLRLLQDIKYQLDTISILSKQKENEQDIITETVDSEKTLGLGGTGNVQSSSKKEKPCIRILHLSDIHLGTVSDAHKYSTQLEIDLKKELKVDQLDYRVISGDIANQSTPNEYDTAFYLIDNLLKRFKLNSRRIIIVPGNHDVNWELSETAYKFVPKRKIPESLPKECFISLDEKNALVRDEILYQQRFANFSKNFYEKVYDGKKYPLDYFEQGILHESIERYHHYDNKRGIHIIGAGTFGAPAREQVTGIPLQYNLLVFDPETRKISVNSRKKEKPDGAWSADARWGDKNNPVPSYTIDLR
jgi:hypothetical protein